MLICSRMWDRIDATRSDSDAAVFYDLLFLGELVTKLATLGLLAGTREGPDRHRYRNLHRLVRANGVGEWASALDDILTGPISADAMPQLASSRRELTERFAVGSDSWQRTAVDLLQRVKLNLDPSQLPSSGKVSLKQWFNDFSGLRNRTRGHGAPTPSICQNLVPELEQSLRVLTSNFGLFTESWCFLRQNMSGKYRVSPISIESPRFSQLKSDSASPALAEGVYIDVGTHLERVPLLLSDPDLSDFYFANGNFKSRSDGTASFECLSYSTDDRRDVDGGEYVLEPTLMPSSETAGNPNLDVEGDCFVNIPQRVVGYVGRPQLEQELLTILRNNRHPIVTLVGPGGIGKTSVAIEALHELAASGEFFAIVWLSARDIDLIETGAKVVRPEVLSVAEMGRTLAGLMNAEWRGSNSFNPSQFFADLLSGKFVTDPLLIVLDNFETLQNPLEVYQFVDAHVRLPNKALLTSRFRDFKADYPVVVGGMSRLEFDELAERTAIRLGVESLLTTTYLETLFDESDGHPYVVKILLGELERERHLGTVRRVLAGKDEILSALFERTYASLAASVQRVFLTLCTWRSLTPRVALEATLLRPENERIDVRAAIESLVRSSLVEIVPGKIESEDFVRVPLAALTFGQKKLKVSSMRAAIDADSEFLRGFGVTNRSEASAGLQPRIQKMIKAIAQKQATGSEVDQEIAIAEYVARHYPQMWRLLSRLYEDLSEIPQAIAAMTSLVEETPTDRAAWAELARLYRIAGDIRGELTAITEIARLPKASSSDISTAALALTRHVAVGDSVLDRDELRSIFQELVAAMERVLPQLDATDLSRLAWLHIKLNERDSAKSCIKLGLSLDANNEHCLKMATWLL